MSEVEKGPGGVIADAELPAMEGGSQEPEHAVEAVEVDAGKGGRVAVAVFVVLLLFVVLGGIGFGVMKMLEVDDAVTVASVGAVAAEPASLPGQDDIKQAATFVPPPVPTIEQVQSVEPDYSITKLVQPVAHASAGPVEHSSTDPIALEELKLQVNGLSLQMKELERTINRLTNDVSNSQNAMNTNMQATITGIETVARLLRDQQDKVLEVSDYVRSETVKSKRNGPPFNVVAKSIWGDVVYLTVSTGNNFAQQATVGSEIGDWRLKSINMAKKVSSWTSKDGGTHELAIP